MPGMMRCVMVGIEVSVAFCISFVQLSKYVSTSSSVGLGCVGIVCCDNVCLYSVLFALWKDLRGRMGICLGFADMVAIMGIWSDGVMGPGCRCMLWKALLLCRTLSGDVVPLWVMWVGKYGPM